MKSPPIIPDFKYHPLSFNSLLLCNKTASSTHLWWQNGFSDLFLPSGPLYLIFGGRNFFFFPNQLCYKGVREELVSSLVYSYYSDMLRIWSKLALLARGERKGWNGTVSMTRDTWTWLGTWESMKRIESVREVQKEHSGPQEGQLEEGWKIPLNPYLDSGYIYHQHSLSFHEGRTHPSFMSSSCHGVCQQYHFLHYMTSLPRQLSPQGWSSEKRKEGRRGSRVGCKGS